MAGGCRSPGNRNCEVFLAMYDRLKGERKMSIEEYDVSCIKFKYNENLDTINDYIISILAGFKDTENLSEAVDLLIKYYEKKPQIFRDFYIVCTRYWGIDHTSDRNNYYSIKIVIEKLNDFIKILNKYIINFT